MRYRTLGSGVVIFSSLILLIFGCVKEYSNQILPNIPPKTFLWLFPDSSIAEGPSKQRIRWWGEDQDGFIIGYLLAVTPDISIIPDPDNLRYIFTTNSDTTIRFPLLQEEQKFFVVVRAIDNNFKGLPQDAHVHLMPKPYWDKNANDILDSNDVELMDLLGAMDPIAAKQQFPTINSPPMVSYLRDPLDPSKVI